MVLLYKDPEGVDIFPTQTGPQFTVDMTQGGQHDFVDVDAFKHKIKQLENELMKYNKVCSSINQDLRFMTIISHRKYHLKMKSLCKGAKCGNRLVMLFSDMLTSVTVVNITC